MKTQDSTRSLWPTTALAVFGRGVAVAPLAVVVGRGIPGLSFDRESLDVPAPTPWQINPGEDDA